MGTHAHTNVYLPPAAHSALITVVLFALALVLFHLHTLASIARLSMRLETNG